MNLDDAFRRSRKTTASVVAPPPLPTGDLVARAQRRRRNRRAAVGVSGALALTLVATFGATRPSKDTASTLASGNSTNVTSPVDGGDDGTSGAATFPTTSTTQSVVSAGTGYAPPPPTVTTKPTRTGAPTTTSATAPSTTGDVVVTQDDAGKTFTLQRGQRLIVNLSGNGWDYSKPETDDDAVLHLVSGNADPATGDATATFTGNAAGMARVSASKDAPCRKSSPPCMTPTYLFQATVNVR